MNEYREDEKIITTTYSVKESKGSALGLEGNQALYVVGGIFVSFLLAFYGMIVGWSIKSLLAAIIIPPVFSYIYVLIFFKGKPPGYQKALLHGLLLGSDDDVKDEQRMCNPYCRAKKDNIQNEYNSDLVQ